jgi:glycosyltransferase involved in cell wall biosynthesis
LSSLSVPVPESDVKDIVLDQKGSSTPREWDGYIAHLDNFWDEVKPEWSHHFEDVLALPHTPQLLIDATGLEPVLNGTSRVAIDFFDQLLAQISSDDKEWNVTVVVPKDARTQLGLNYPGFSCVESLDNIDNTFDVAVSITPINTVSRCLSVLRMSLRWMVIHLDIIAIRSLPHLSQHVQARSAVEFYLENADEIITISEFSRNDLISYFGNPDTTRIKVVTLGIPASFTPNTLPEEFDLTSGGVFVVGNALPHKQVNKAVQVLISAGLNVTTIGGGEAVSARHRVMSPRDVDDAMLQRILNESSVIVFPSRYEGFGLPIVEAAQAKRPIVLADTEINREVTKLLGRENQTVFFTKLKDILAAVSQAQQLMNSDNGKIPLLSEFSEQILHEAQDLLSQPLNCGFVEKRWRTLTFMHAAMTEQEEHTIHELSLRRLSQRISHKFTGLFR